MKVSLKLYGGVVGLVQALVCGVPLGFSHFRNNQIYTFPPLGESMHTYIPMACIFIGIAALIPWFIKFKYSKFIFFCLCASISGIFYVKYTSLLQRKVISFSNPKVDLTVGTVRSDFANKIFPPDTTDYEILHSWGPYEYVVQKMWTPDSIIGVRHALLMQYVILLMCTNVMIGCLALSEAEKPRVSKNTARRRGAHT